MPSADTNGVNGAPSIPDSHIVGGHPKARTQLTKPLVYEGSLDRFTHRDLTPVIGREYEGLQVTELLAANNEQLIKDLAVTGMSDIPRKQDHVLKRDSFTTRGSLSPESGGEPSTNEGAL
jgi:hypothetical protein